MNTSKIIIGTVSVAILGTSVFAGAIDGPQRANTQVKANSIDRFTVNFRENERAIVCLKGDGDTDLDLYIYDENGNLVAKDIDNTDTCAAVWTPKWSGHFTIQVKNRGNVYNCYKLYTN